MHADKHYQDFNTVAKDLESIVTALSMAPDIRTLNSYERQAQQALFNLQHVSMGLAYWVQSVAQSRRRAINSGEIVVEKTETEKPKEEPKEEPKPKKKTTRRRKKNVVQES